MSRRRGHTDGPHGLLLVDKPAGISSAAVVARARRVLGGVKAGHTGTLDPFATGLLPLGLGEGTKLATFLADADKSYEGTIRLGIHTDTHDGTGKVLGSLPVPAIEAARIDELAAEFRGEILQVPPSFSAIKRGGRPMYELARRGEAPELEARPARVDRLELRAAGGDRVAVSIDCSKGFYVRSLARDLGEALGCGAILETLRRTRVGRFRIEDAIALDSMEKDGAEAATAAILPLAEALSHLRRVDVSQAEAEALRLGRQGPLLRMTAGAPLERVRIVQGADLVAVARWDGKLWFLDRVFQVAPRPAPDLAFLQSTC